MEDYIQISKINDFIFCPYSLYFHGIYENFSEKTYHDSPQTRGKIKHENIEEGRYSSAKKYLQGIDVYSEKYGLAGKIDIYDKEEKTLIERKNKVAKIYDGYRYQLYAQYFGLAEMGHETERIKIHSLSDNKRYDIPLPVGRELEKFEAVIAAMKNFRMENGGLKINPAKCARCIYRQLCTYALAE